MMRWLQLSAPSVGSSASFRDLASFVREHDCAGEWLTLLESEWGYIMALARGVAEQRAEAKKEVSHGQA